MDKSRVYFKNSILQKLDAIHNENGISDTEYWQLVQDVDQCEDLDTLKDMNDLVFLSNYISHIDSDILEMINESQV